MLRSDFYRCITLLYFLSLCAVSIWVVIETIFPASASIEIKSIIKSPAPEAISDKYGIRLKLLSCLTKLSEPNDMDCQGRDKKCCLLIKLAQQRKNKIHGLKLSPAKVINIDLKDTS